MEQINLQPTESKDNYLTGKENIYLLLYSLFLGLLFNFLFYGKPFGLSYPLYIAALYGILFRNMQKNQQLKFSWTWLWGIAILALSLTYFIFSNEIFTFFNFLMIPALLVAHTLLLTSNNRYQWFEPWFLADMLQGMFVRPLANCLKPFLLLAKITKHEAHSDKFRVTRKVLTGILVAIPLLIIIIPLLSSADDIFDHFLDLIPNIFNINITEFLARLIIVTIITCLVFSYLWSLFRSGDKAKGTIPDIKNLLKPKAFLDPITVTTILVLIDILYIFFITIQFSYLFGSLNYGLPTDFTYAEYARKGFFELVLITIINLAILLGNLYFGKVSGSRIDKAVKVLNSVLVVSTLIMLLSAHFRMSLYEEAYGFTYLRVLTHAFMIYLFVLFIATLVKIWYKPLILLKFYIVISIAAYTLVNYINVDRLIVINNIERYDKGYSLDIDYLTTLSYDAVPLLIDFRNKTSDQELVKQLENGLQSKKQALEKTTPWQSLSISRSRAQKAFSQ
jgi:hypothetical protein